MRAAIQTGLRQIEVRDVEPPAESDATVVVRTIATGVCGSDLHPYHGRAAAQTRPEGHEVAGEIVGLPRDYVGPLELGNLVAVDTVCLGVACGTCAACLSGQPFHCPARAGVRWGGSFGERFERLPAGLFRLPAAMTPQQGALVEPLAVAVHAIRWSRMRPGARVAVVGAGTIGLMTLLAARGLGAAEVHVVARHEHQAQAAADLGAASVLRGSDPDVTAALRERTGGEGADLVVETVGGHADTVSLCWELARIQGTVAVLGIFPERVPVDLLRPVVRELWATFPICYGTIDGRHDFDVAIDLIASGAAPVDRLVTHRFPLEQAAEAFRVAADKGTGSIKVQMTL